MGRKKTYNQLTTEQFQEKVHKFYPNIDIISEYINAHSPVTYQCNICGTVGVCKDANSMMRGQSGCGICNGRKLVKGKNDFATKYPQLVKYFVNKEDAENNTYGSGKKVLMKCPICGEEKLYRIADLSNKGFCCSKCSDGISYPNKFMYCLLKQLNVNFEKEVVFNWSQNKRYDFVLDNVIIEMDGSFHLGSKYSSYEEVKEIDDLKDRLALDNGYEMVRIPCYKSDFIYIKDNILKSKLKNILELDKVDWVSLEKEITDTNFVKIACDYFNEYKGKIRMIDIAKISNIPISTLCTLLKIGARLNMTDYDENISSSGGYTPREFHRDNKHKVKCLETNQIFQSAKEAEEYYHLDKDAIARVCRGERLTVRGLHFDWIGTTIEIQEKKNKMQENKNKKSHAQKKVICVETNEIFDSATEASLHFGKGRGYVSNIMRKDKPSNLGYHFKYLEE